MSNRRLKTEESTFPDYLFESLSLIPGFENQQHSCIR